MFRTSILNRFTPLAIAGVLITASHPAAAQSVLDRMKGAAEEAARKVEDAVNQQMQQAPGTWEMGADGTLTVVAQAGDAIKRFRITPAADTSVDTIGR